MILPSLQSPLYFGHTNLKFLKGVKSSNKVYSPIPTSKRCITTQRKHLTKTLTPTKLKHLIFWAFDQKPSKKWTVGPLEVNVENFRRSL